MILPVLDMAGTWPALPRLSGAAAPWCDSTGTVRRMDMSRLSRISASVIGVALLAGCTDQGGAPTGLGVSASRSGLPFTEGLASPAWQQKAAALVAQAGFNPQTATHAYALLGVAQYLGVQRVEAADAGTDVVNLAS